MTETPAPTISKSASKVNYLWLYLGLFALSLVVRLIVNIVWLKQPGIVDAYYYYQIGQNWHNGQGLVENTLWNYQFSNFNPASPLTSGNVTHPAFDYWNPLASWLVIISFSIFGASWWAASLPFILCTAALTPLAFYLGQLAFGRGQLRYSLTMAAVTLVAGRYFLFWNTTDNFAPFALLSLACLICIYKGLYQHEGWLIAAGGLSGLAYLSRSDGILLSITLVIGFLWVKLRGSTALRMWLPHWSSLILALSAALLVVSPWLVRNINEFGTPVSSVGSRAIFLRQYEELFTYSVRLDASYYFSWGIDKIITAKLVALGLIALLIAVQGLFMLGPFFAGGLLLSRRRLPAAFGPFMIYLVIFYLTMALVFGEVGTHGTVFHSAGGLLPFQAGLAVMAIDWLCRNLTHRRKRIKFQFLSAAIIGLLLLINFYLSVQLSTQTAAPWDNDIAYASRLGQWMRQNQLAESAIIIGEPLSYYYVNRQPAIGLASDGVAPSVAAARKYGARYLVLGPERYPTFEQLYKSKAAPGLKLLAEFEANQIYEIVGE